MLIRDGGLVPQRGDQIYHLGTRRFVCAGLAQVFPRCVTGCEGKAAEAAVDRGVGGTVLEER